MLLEWINQFENISLITRYLILLVAAIGGSVFFYALFHFLGTLIKRYLKIPFGYEYEILCGVVAVFLSFYLIKPYVLSFRIFTIIIFIASYFTIYNVSIRKINKTRIAYYFPEILQDLLRIFLLVILLALLLNFLYSYSITGLFASAGILSIIVGFASQSTLNDMIGGLIIHFDHSISIGDWIEISPGPGGPFKGFITNQTWRSITIRDTDNVHACIPNSVLTSKGLKNYSLNSSLHRCTLELSINIFVDPFFLSQEIENQAFRCRHVLKTPPPIVQFSSFKASNEEMKECVFFVYFWVSDITMVELASHELNLRFWNLVHHLRHQDCYGSENLPTPGKQANELVHFGLTRYEAVRNTLFSFFEKNHFDGLDAEILARSASVEFFFPDEKIIEEGDQAGPLFFLLQGKAEVITYNEGKLLLLDEISDGNCFGESSILKEKRKASVIAKTVCQVISIPEHALKEFIIKYPQAVEIFSELLAKKKALSSARLEKMSLEEKNKFIKKETKSFTERIKKLFHLG